MVLFPKVTANEKSCLYCGSTISRKAILCPVCKSYQSRERNTLVYLASIAGLIGLIGSAFVYIVTNLPNVHRILLWSDQVRVWKFASELFPEFEMIVTNVGDGPVLLSSIILKFARGGNTQFEINRELSKDATFSSKIQEYNGEYYNGVFVSKTGEVDIALAQASAMVEANNQAAGPCVSMQVMKSDDTSLDRLNDYYSSRDLKVITEPVHATLSYYSVHFKRVQNVEFPALTIFVRSTRTECQKMSLER